MLKVGLVDRPSDLAREASLGKFVEILRKKIPSISAHETITILTHTGTMLPFSARQLSSGLLDHSGLLQKPSSRDHVESETCTIAITTQRISFCTSYTRSSRPLVGSSSKGLLDSHSDGSTSEAFLFFTARQSNRMSYCRPSNTLTEFTGFAGGTSFFEVVLSSARDTQQCSFIPFV